MSENTKYQIHPDYDLYFQTVGNTIQTRVGLISPKDYNQDSSLVMIEPGRTILIGDVTEQLKALFSAAGKPALNEMTATEGRPGGIFSSSSFLAIRDFLFDGPKEETPRIRKTEVEQPRVYRDSVPA